MPLCLVATCFKLENSSTFILEMKLEPHAFLENCEFSMRLENKHRVIWGDQGGIVQ